MTQTIVDKSKITRSQAKELAEYGFKWYKDSCTDRVEPELIARVYPTTEGLIVMYTDDSALQASIAKVDHVEWRTDPSKEWIYVHWIDIEDIRNPDWKKEIED